MGVGGWNHQHDIFYPTFLPPSQPSPCKGEGEKPPHLRNSYHLRLWKVLKLWLL